MAHIERIRPPLQTPRRVRVAAYARISAVNERSPHSLAAQVSHYIHLIEATPTWQYVGVFSDNGKTGTNQDRDGFQDLMATYRADKSVG